MHVKGDLLDFAVFFEGCFLVVSVLLLDGNGLGFSPKVVDILLAWGVAPLYVSRKLLVATDSDDPRRSWNLHAQVQLMNDSFKFVDGLCRYPAVGVPTPTVPRLA